MSKDGFYGSGDATGTSPTWGGNGVGYSDVNWRLDQLVSDMNIMWAKIAELETTRDEKSEPYDVMDSFRATKPDAGEPANRYFVDCLKENAQLIEENDVIKYQYETMHKETVRCKVQIEQLQKALADKQKVLESVMDQRDRFIKTVFAEQRKLDELTKANAYWEDLCQKLQMENADLKYRSNHFEIVEYQTARECTEIVNRIKNDPLTTMSSSREWMVAVCEDIEKAIKKEFDLK